MGDEGQQRIMEIIIIAVIVIFLAVVGIRGEDAKEIINKHFYVLATIVIIIISLFALFI